MIPRFGPAAPNHLAKHSISITSRSAEILVRLERNFGRMHARRYTGPVLFTETAELVKVARNAIDIAAGPAP
jgi:hypothetical protein